MVRVRVFAGAFGIESGAINVSNVSHSRRLRGDSSWLVPAMKGRSPRAVQFETIPFPIRLSEKPLLQLR
jgi:hypothetical protein